MSILLNPATALIHQQLILPLTSNTASAPATPYLLLALPTTIPASAPDPMLHLILLLLLSHLQLLLLLLAPPKCNPASAPGPNCM
jgi:hypothetical protein